MWINFIQYPWSSLLIIDVISPMSWWLNSLFSVLFPLQLWPWNFYILESFIKCFNVKKDTAKGNSGRRWISRLILFLSASGSVFSYAQSLWWFKCITGYILGVSTSTRLLQVAPASLAQAPNYIFPYLSKGSSDFLQFAISGLPHLPLFAFWLFQCLCN